METEAIDSIGPSGLQVLATHGVNGEFTPRPDERREVDMESGTRIRELVSSWGNVEDMTIDRKAVYRSHARTVHALAKGWKQVFVTRPIFAGCWHECCKDLPIQKFSISMMRSGIRESLVLLGNPLNAPAPEAVAAIRTA